MSFEFLDLRTLSIVLVLITTFLSVVMLFIWRINKTYLGYSFWAASNLAIAAGFLFVSLRGMIPDVFAIIFANILAFGGVLLVLEGNRRFFGLKSSKWFSLSMLALHTLAVAYFVYVDRNVIIRIIITSIFLTIISLLNAFEFYRHRPKENALIYKLSGATYIAFGLLMLMRAGFTYSFSNINDLYAPDLIQSVFFLTFIIFAIVWTFEYLILSNDRLHRELKTTQAELETMATTDFLTGINNNRHFFEIGNNEIQRVRRFPTPLAVIMVDIDYFKQVNDTHGHAAGDKVLIEIVGICQNSIRNIDVLGRLGGEEFAVLLPHTDIHGGVTTAEHLRTAIEEAEIKFSSEIIKVTASFGVTVLYDTDKDIKQLLDRADKFLYQAKNRGRNQVIFDPRNYQNLAAA